MLLNKQQAPALDVSASLSAVDELVQVRLQQIAEEFEEQQILHERTKQDELKELDRQKKVQMAQIAEDAEDELEYMRDRIKHEIKASQEGGMMNEEYRRQELTDQSKAAVTRAREKENAKFERQQDELKGDHADQVDHLKVDQKDRHDRETQSIKDRFQAKLDLERQRMAQSNNQLLEESGDIDQ